MAPVVEGTVAPRAGSELLLAAAERAIDRAQRLQAVTAALVGAATPDEIARVVAAEGRSALGAAVGLVWLLVGERLCLDACGVSGETHPPADFLARFSELPLDADLPAAEAARDGQPVWLESREAAIQRFPAVSVVVAPRCGYAAAVLPLVAPSGCQGVVAFRFGASRRFDEDERVFLLTLSRVAAQALERARLHAALCRSEERYRLAARAMHELVYEFVPGVGTSFCSEGPVFGYDPVSAPDPHRWWAERLHADDVARVTTSFHEYLESTAETWVAKYRFRRADGSYAHVLDRAVARRVDGRLRRLIGTMLDVSAEQQADDRLRELLNGLPGTIVWERELASLRVTFLSDSVKGLLGYEAARWRDDDACWLAHVHPDDRERVVSLVRAHVAAGLDLELDYRMLAADGRTVWLRERVRCVRDAEGTVVRLRGFMLEVTALKAAEDQRARAQRRAALLAEASRTLAWSLDLRETLATVARLATPELADWCAVYLGDEGHGARLVAAAHAQPSPERVAAAWRLDRALRADPRRGVRRVIQSGVTERGLEAVPAARTGEGGPERPPMLVSYIVVPLTARGRTLGAMCLLDAARRYDGQDVVCAEELASRAALAIDNAQLYGALAAERSRLEALVRAAPVSIMLLDLDGTVRLWNPAAERTFGWSADEVLGRPLPAVPEERRHELERALARVRSGRSVLDLHTIARREDGASLEVTLWAAPVPGPSGRRQCLSIVADVTQTRQLERELRTRADELAERDRRKDEFLSMLGHELRNPLAPLLSALELLERHADDAATVARARPILERQARHMARLVDDLLDVARITRGTISLRPELVDAGEALRRALESAEPAVRARGHRVRCHAAPTPLVWADPVRLEQVLVNLLTNAARYMDPGGLIEVEAGASGDEVHLRVRDFGVGIPPQLLPHVFDAFTQGPRGLHRDEGGLGLGLTVVRRLVELHGGRVEARSAGRGEGSEFVVTLPRAPGAVDAAAPGARTRLPPGPAPVVRRDVLLVDDNVDAAAILAEILGGEGHVVRVVHDGRAAQRAVDEHPPDVVLLDLGLPGLDGFEVARWLRARPGRAPLLIAVTGYGDASHRRRSQEAGFDHYLVKPIDFSRLYALLDG